LSLADTIPATIADVPTQDDRDEELRRLKETISVRDSEIERLRSELVDLQKHVAVNAVKAEPDHASGMAGTETEQSLIPGDTQPYLQAYEDSQGLLYESQNFGRHGGTMKAVTVRVKSENVKAETGREGESESMIVQTAQQMKAETLKAETLNVKVKAETGCERSDKGVGMPKPSPETELQEWREKQKRTMSREQWTEWNKKFHRHSHKVKKDLQSQGVVGRQLEVHHCDRMLHWAAGERLKWKKGEYQYGQNPVEEVAEEAAKVPVEGVAVADAAPGVEEIAAEDVEVKVEQVAVAEAALGVEEIPAEDVEVPVEEVAVAEAAPRVEEVVEEAQHSLAVQEMLETLLEAGVAEELAGQMCTQPFWMGLRGCVGYVIIKAKDMGLLKREDGKGIKRQEYPAGWKDARAQKRLARRTADMDRHEKDATM